MCNVSFYTEYYCGECVCVCVCVRACTVGSQPERGIPLLVLHVHVSPFSLDRNLSRHVSQSSQLSSDADLTRYVSTLSCKVQHICNISLKIVLIGGEESEGGRVAVEALSQVRRKAHDLKYFELEPTSLLNAHLTLS